MEDPAVDDGTLDELEVRVLANDPRFCPEEALIIQTFVGQWTLGELETLPGQLRDECGWGMGYEEEITKNGGGIGADGATVLALILGVVGVVPTIEGLLLRLGRSVQGQMDRDMAIALARRQICDLYAWASPSQLRTVSEETFPHHRVFGFSLTGFTDTFEVEVHGDWSTRTAATRILWTGGDSSATDESAATTE